MQPIEMERGDQSDSVRSRPGVRIPRLNWFSQGRSLRFFIAGTVIVGTMALRGESASAAQLGAGGMEHSKNPSDSIAARADAGPKPKIEDYANLEDYLKALLRWLYIVNGGDPADLDNASIEDGSKLVQDLYANGLNGSEAASRIQEIVAAAQALMDASKSSELTVPQQSALVAASTAVQGAVSQAR
jgi:hypothetical protein